MAYLPIGNQLLQLGPLNAHFPLLIQWYKILGPAWGSFSVLLIPYLWYKLSKHSIKKVYPITISTFLLIINIIMYVSQDQEIQQKRIAGIVSLKNSEDSSKISSILIENSDEKVDYILIPEAVFLMDKHLYEFHPKITDIKRCLKDSLNNASLIMGLWLQDNLDYKYNVAIKYSPYNRNLTIRNKVLLVPFSEYIPSFLKKFDFITDNLKHTIRPMDNSVEFFFHNSDIISCLICYESLFTNYLCEKTLGNAQFFNAISSNTGTDSNHNETVSVNILKTNAVATNRYIARAAEHGISLIINPKGTITISSNYKTDYIIGKIYLKTTNTFYAIHHKTINYLYLGVVFILLICILIPVNLMYTALFAAS